MVHVVVEWPFIYLFFSSKKSNFALPKKRLHNRSDSKIYVLLIFQRMICQFMWNLLLINLQWLKVAYSHLVLSIMFFLKNIYLQKNPAICKVRIFWEGHKILWPSQNIRTLLLYTIETAKNMEIWWKLYQFSDRFEYLIRFLNLEVGHIGSKQISFNYLLINNDW